MCLLINYVPFCLKWPIFYYRYVDKAAVYFLKGFHQWNWYFLRCAKEKLDYELKCAGSVSEGLYLHRWSISF